MNYLLYCALFVFFLSHPTLSMELAKTTEKSTPGFIFVTDEQPPQKFKVPLHLAMQCQSIKNMVEDLSEMTAEQEWPLQNNCEENLLHFISYLKKIDLIANSEPESPKKSALNDALCIYLQTLNNGDLINLTQITDTLNVIDTNNHNHITEELAKRILIASPSKRECFFSLDNLVLFRFVKEKINKRSNLDQTFIQPYITTLTEKLYPPKTEPISTVLYNKVYNPPTFPYKGTIILKKPHYVNNQTKTTIIGTVIQDIFKPTTTQLRIIKKEPLLDIAIELNKIEYITHISANKDESLFICNYIHQGAHYACVIRPANKNNPIIKAYHEYAFTNNNNHELYVSRDTTFGILNTQSDTFTKIDLHNNNICPIFNITTNRDGTIVAVNTGWDIFIGRKKETLPIVFEKLDRDILKKNLEHDWDFIANICLHPHENKLYLEARQALKTDSCIIDIPSQKIILRIPLYPAINRHVYNIAFISTDILFLEQEIEDDYFFNIRTGNYWSKKKTDSSLYYKRITLSTDYMQSIEEKYTYNDSYEQTVETQSIQLINHPIIKTIDLLNTGDFPLMLLNIAQSTPKTIALSPDKYASYDNMKQELKDVVAASYTITGTSPLSRLMGIIRNIYQPTAYYTKPVIKWVGYILASVALMLFINQCDITKKNRTTL